jgi:hypothetical protein
VLGPVVDDDAGEGQVDGCGEEDGANRQSNQISMPYYSMLRFQHPYRRSVVATYMRKGFGSNGLKCI